MTQEEKTKIEEKIVDVLKTVYDPEIPVNIWDLGMIYKIDVKDDATVDLDMTFTAPSCPAADFILEDVRTKVDSVEGVKSANVNLVFEPAWDQSMTLGAVISKQLVKCKLLSLGFNGQYGRHAKSQNGEQLGFPLGIFGKLLSA